MNLFVIFLNSVAISYCLCFSPSWYAVGIALNAISLGLMIGVMIRERN